MFYNYNLAFNSIFCSFRALAYIALEQLLSAVFFYKYLLFLESDPLMSLLRYLISFTYVMFSTTKEYLSFIFEVYRLFLQTLLITY